VRPLDEIRMSKLTSSWVKLSELIDPDDSFITELAVPQAACITWSQRDHIVKIAQHYDRNVKLFAILTRRSVADFETFVRVLSNHQGHLVCFLTDEGERHFFLSGLANFTYVELYLPTRITPC